MLLFLDIEATLTYTEKPSRAEQPPLATRVRQQVGDFMEMESLPEIPPHVISDITTVKLTIFHTNGTRE